VLRSHALEHEVHRQLEAEILEEEREVEALVELDRHEHRLDRERRAVGLQRVDVHAAGRLRGVARLEEAPPGLRGGRRGRLDQRAEERLAEDLGRGPPEQQLSRLGPLGDRPLAVREHEVAAHDLPQDVVERLRRLGRFGQGRVGFHEGIHGGSSLLASSIGRTRPHVQPFVEKYGSRARVQRRFTPRLLRERGREALVVELDRHAHGAAQPLGELARLARLAGVAARERDRQADDHALRPQLLDQLREAAQAGGKDPSKLPDALDAAREAIAAALSG